MDACKIMGQRLTSFVYFRIASFLLDGAGLLLHGYQFTYIIM